MEDTSIIQQSDLFKGILASIWKFNKSSKEFLFPKNFLIMIGLTCFLEPNKWYGLEDKDLNGCLISDLVDFDKLLSFLQNFDEKNVTDFKFNLVFKSKLDSYYLEGFLENDIVIVTAIEAETNEQIGFLENEGLTNAKIGLRWIERINDEYRIFHMNSSKDLYGLAKNREVSRKIFSGEWEAIAGNILKKHPKYIEYFDNNKKQLKDLTIGIIDNYIIKSPWVDNDGEIIWVEDRVTVVSRNEDGFAELIVATTIDITERVLNELSIIELESKNELLRIEKERLMSAERLAIRSGRVMIWYLDSSGANKTDYFYGNELLFVKLGLSSLEGSRFLIDEFNESIYSGDAEGLELSTKYFEMDDRVENGEIDSYDKVLVKHQNIKTKEIFYFEHNFEVEKRFNDGGLMVRGGFMADVTEEIFYKKRNEFLVGHDSVTGLFNRNEFERYILSGNMPKKYTLIIADIDGLKLTNDAFGHIKGDESIAFVGNQFSNVFSVSAMAFRIGGDEFAVISSEINEDEINRKIEQVKANILEFSLDSSIQISVSVGYEIVIHDGLSFSDSFTKAENLMYRRKLNDRNSRKSKTMEAILETLHMKTEETKDHCDRLGYYAVETLKKLGYTRNSDLEDIEILCQLHDIGKITISEDILSKKGKLTTEEFEKIKGHSEAGYKIVKNIVDEDNIAYGVLYHHERIDGTGYPFGLVDEEIPLFSKIISICDAYDVMISGRKYSKKISKKAAVDEIRRCSGTQFDKRIAEVFIEIIIQEN